MLQLCWAVSSPLHRGHIRHSRKHRKKYLAIWALNLRRERSSVSLSPIAAKRMGCGDPLTLRFEENEVTNRKF